MHKAFLICAGRAVKRRLAPGDLDFIRPHVAETEADLEWIIARRVRKLCGLSTYLPRIPRTPPRTQATFVRRYRQVNLDCLEIDRRVARPMAGLQRASFFPRCCRNSG